MPELSEHRAKELIQERVNEWSKVYINQVFFKALVNDVYEFQVEFSKPKQVKPIPEGTVKADFYVYNDENDETVVEFNFENESLRHRDNMTMRSNMYESWINFVLEKKLKVKTELHLGSEFEHTRSVTESGQKADPFVPAFDIMKVKNL